MTLRATCPACGCEADIEAFFAEGDGKRLAARFAELEPALGRAVLGYLRLFKPAKQALRVARAIRLVEDLLALITDGSVCRDERTPLARPAPTALWVAGIEQMLANPPSGVPLANHHYLRAVVFGLAEQAAAAAEQRREEDRRLGRQRGTGSTSSAAADPLADEIAYARRMHDYGQFSAAQRDAYIAQARQRHEGAT